MEWPTTTANQWYSGALPEPATETRYEALMIRSQHIIYNITYYLICSIYDLICSIYDLICSIYDVAEKTCYIIYYVMDLGVPRTLLDYDIIVKIAI